MKSDKHNVPPLLAADIVAAARIASSHMAVAHLGAEKLQPPCSTRCRSSPRLDMMVATTPPPTSRPFCRQPSREQRHELIAVHHPAVTRRP